jgi:predicted ATPase
LDGAGRTIAIEQPELHIHPRLQAEIADLFVEAVRERRHRFLIETHSEHFILRLQRRVRETSGGTAQGSRELRSDDIAVYYVKQENGGTRFHRIDIDKNGEFIQPWPDDFFEIDFYERFGHAG